MTPRTADPVAAIWQDVECGAYDADLPLWEELAGQAGGPILELGCGSGRVLLHLGRRGHNVTGVDADLDLVGAATERCTQAGVAGRALVADARELALGDSFALIVAPMQLAQLVGGPAERATMLAGIARHLEPRGRAALALVSTTATPGGRAWDGSGAPVPDVRQRDGWLYSSLPLSVREDGGTLMIERLRQTVSPEGDLSDALHVERLEALPAEELEHEAEAAALAPVERRSIPRTNAHAGSEVVILEGR